jgi:molybdopterin-dependent oxidoreductase alpha subunit
MPRPTSFKPYDRPSGGWGSAKSVMHILAQEGVTASGWLTLARQNKVDGFQCVSCSWAKPAKPLPFEFCENGAKATAWDITLRRASPGFFARHTVAEMRGWDDYQLERAGRLTHPLRYDHASDTYVPVQWAEAFAAIGRELRAIEDRKSVVFYSSGKMSNEASYMYGLMARMYGNNNLPDSSNMCHETTSVALPESIGVPVGTTTLDDFAKTGCILFFGQNASSNSPRMLHPLQEASRRGVPIIVFNPLRERGLESFTNPQAPAELLSGEETRISSAYHQVKPGGDLAALTGICKVLVEMDEAQRETGGPGCLDHGFIAEHCTGFDALTAFLRRQEWPDLESRSGLHRSALEATAAVYSRAPSAMGLYGMGLTQHHAGVETIQMLVNLLLLRGNIGRAGAGICPVRGHSNVQGQRTVGITEKVKLVPNERLAAQYGFEPPREDGYNTVEACEAILDGKVRAFIMFGGNFLRAIPDRDRMEPAWSDIPLTVNVVTRLNRSHLFPGASSYILPVISRIENDRQASGMQSVSMEDSLACIHGSKGVRSPASPALLSEPRVVAELAKGMLDPNPKVDWDAWVDDYSRIRLAISETYPEIFPDYERRMWQPGGIHRPLPARERVWKTPTGKANMIVPRALDEDADMPEAGPDVLRMITLRSNDQFNTTVYGYDDRFRGIYGTRMVVLMNADDIARLGLAEGDMVTLATSTTRDSFKRELGGLRVTPYNIPAGCVGAYYPEANNLIPVWHYAEGSKVPAAKSVPVVVRKGV